MLRIKGFVLGFRKSSADVVIDVLELVTLGEERLSEGMEMFFEVVVIIYAAVETCDLGTDDAKMCVTRVVF